MALSSLFEGGDGDGRKERSQCFNLGLGGSHCYSNCISGGVRNVFKAIRPDADPLLLSRQRIAESSKSKEVEL